MKELKKHTSIQEQIALMESRGLIVTDKQAAAAVLQNVNYYRLSGYLHDFKQPDSDVYVEGLTWERLKKIYDFDRRLTRLLMYALEDIEETLKTRLSYAVTSRHPDDPLIYLRPTIYRGYETYLKFQGYFYEEVDANRKLPFVKHHVDTYGGQLPMWVAVELFTMGNLHAVYDNLNTPYQKAIAKAYNTGPIQLSNWIKNLTYTRNHLAHYMRIYNFNFGRTPMKCRQHPRYSKSTNMIFDQLYVIACMYSDPAEWNHYVVLSLKSILEEYSGDIQLDSLGFPDDWEDVLLMPGTVKEPVFSGQ